MAYCLPLEVPACKKKQSAGLFSGLVIFCLFVSILVSAETVVAVHADNPVTFMPQKIKHSFVGRSNDVSSGDKAVSVELIEGDARDECINRFYNRKVSIGVLIDRE